jgi:hypothetical protein
MKATEMRFRTHSEHKIYGKYYDLEMQVYHILKIGILPRSLPVLEE